MKQPGNGAPAGVAATALSSGEGGENVKIINPELWQACAGPLVNLPPAGTHVVYFPQGHSEQVAASMKKDVDAQIPNYPNLPSKLLCLLHSVTLHADPETDQVYAQMTLQPVTSFDKEALLRSDLSLKSNKPQPEFFCKTLTASDTSTHGGFSVPRRAAEKIFPPLDFNMQPPAQELVARDLHDTVWNFRHIYRGQPKRHLLTTGWSLFVSGKRLFAGDAVLFIRDEKQQLLLGIRRANRQPTNLSSSVLSSDSMHIGILAAAAHAAANNSIFMVFYNPRASPSEFVIPLAKYYKAVCANQLSLGMRFRMMFETEESGTRRYMGTITGISDLDAVRWKNSQWRNLQVGWDESTAGERRNRVSIWEIEPVTAPFFICPPPIFRSKRPRQPGMPDDESSDLDNIFKRTMPWLGDDMCMKDPQVLPGLSLVQWMNMQQNPSVASSMQPNYMHPSFSGSIMPNLRGVDLSRQMNLSAPQLPQPNNLQFNAQRLPQQVQQLDQLPKMQAPMNPLASMKQRQQQTSDMTHVAGQNLVNQSLPSSHAQSMLLQPQSLSQTNSVLQQQSSAQNQRQRNFPQNLQQHQQQQQHLQQQQQHQQNVGQNQPQHFIQTSLPDQMNPQSHHLSDNQLQLQLLQKLQQHQQSYLAQQALQRQPTQLHQLQEQQRQLLDAFQSFSRPSTPSQMLDVPLSAPTSHHQSRAMPHQMDINNSNQPNGQFSHLQPQPKNQQQQQPGMLAEISGHTGLPPNGITNQLSRAGSGMMVGVPRAGQPGLTDEGPSCSTSPSTNNCSTVAQPLINNRARQNSLISEHMAQSATMVTSLSALETVPSNGNLVKGYQHKSEVKPSVNIPRNQSQGMLNPHTYRNGAAAQTDYLDTSSSTTSAGLSQNDAHLQHSNTPLAFNPQSILFREPSQEVEAQVDQRNNVSYGSNVDSQLGIPLSSDHLLDKGIVGIGKDFTNNFNAGGMVSNFESAKDAQLSSSMVSQSFGVPDMTFQSIDSAINDSSFLDGGSPWAPAAQFQRMRTYTKVYKRGAVGRSIDITRYSGYDDLKHDLARRFGIEGQLEDRGRVGWKLVYVDHENDVLLVGDDPWEEFVNCVRCIKILSPQEVQQMSLDGDFGGNAVLPNQACSRSDGGNA